MKQTDDDVNLMRSLLQAKCRQSPPFRQKLRATGNTQIVHSTQKRDTFWATGLHYTDSNFSKGFSGKNMHGVLLMEIRRELKPESEYPSIVEENSDGAGNPSAIPLCFHCGVQGHVTRKCWHLKRTVFCFGCGGAGHKQRYCPIVAGSSPAHAPFFCEGASHPAPAIPQYMAERGYGAYKVSMVGRGAGKPMSRPQRQKQPLLMQPSMTVDANTAEDNHCTVSTGCLNANATVFNPSYCYGQCVNEYPVLNLSR